MTVYVLVHDHKHGSDVSVFLSSESQERHYRGLLMETASGDWGYLDDDIRADLIELDKYFDSEHDDYDAERDLMELQPDELTKIEDLVRSGEKEWWESWSVSFEDDEFRQFLFDNLDAFDVGLITELNARIAARKG